MGAGGSLLRKEHAIAALANVPVRNSTEPRDYSTDTIVSFLDAALTIIGVAIQRAQMGIRNRGDRGPR
jgi:hypothetical protein